MSLLRAVHSQEPAVEMQGSWGIAQLRVDGGHAINVCEVVAEAVAMAAERAGAGS